MKMASHVNIFNKFLKGMWFWRNTTKFLYYSDMATRYILGASKQTTSKCRVLVLSNHTDNTIESRTVRVREKIRFIQGEVRDQVEYFLLVPHYMSKLSTPTFPHPLHSSLFNMIRVAILNGFNNH